MKKLALSLVALSAVMAANATVLISLSTGHYGFSGPNYTTTESVNFSTFAPLTPGSALAFSAGNFSFGTGTASFTNGGGTMVLDVALGAFSGSATTSSVAGSWVYDDAASTGVFHGFSGSGTFSQSFHTFNTFAASEFVGDVTAVPEPFSMVALGAGAVALIRRRRNS